MKHAAISTGLLFLLSPAWGQEGTGSADLAHSTMEQLTQMEVSISSVSRKQEVLFQTPAAAYVITREEIARSTADSIPELLRTVPGLQVAQISASTWAVTARGFNSAFANKLLVLVDGRTVYSEIYSGEHWDEVDLPLEEVERIEVIRGPGAVIWGTNAVNGVVNIITRPARTVSGGRLSGEWSRVDNRAVLQGGGTLGNQAQYRELFSLTDRRPLVDRNGASAFGGEQLYRLGARADWRKSATTTLSGIVDAYGGPNRQQVLPSLYVVAVDGANEHDVLFGGSGLLRLEHHTSANSYEVQAYVSSADRHELAARGNTLTEDVDFVDHIRAGERTQLVAGGELRLTQDAIAAPFAVTRSPSYHNYLVDGFVQSDFTLLPNRITATLGTKVQDGTLAGFQLQPSARLGWTVNASQFAWAAVSRSAVAPALQDKELSLGLSLGSSNGLPLTAQLTGNPAFKPETVVAVEVGYRLHFGKHISLDLAAYNNDTRRIQSLATGDPVLVSAPSPAIQVPLLYVNGFASRSQGVESSLDWHPARQLQLRGNYTWLEAQIKQTLPGEVSLTDGFNSARNTFAGTGYWNFLPHWSLQGLVYRVGSFRANDSGAASVLAQQNTASMVPAYTRLDFAAERQIGSRLKLSVGGTNLSSARHLEFGGFTTFLNPQYVPRNFFVRGGWSF